jgi:hypothetical protein
MNKSRAIWGVICLVLAGFLGIMYFVLPTEDLMFTVGDQNLPWVPALILGVVGLILLASSVTTDVKEEHPNRKPVAHIDPEKAALNKRLETICWGLFLIMLGCFMFVPEEIIKGGWWSVGIGMIMLGLNVTRYINQIKMSAFTTFLGILSLVGGFAQVLGWSALDNALFFILLGAFLLSRPIFDKKDRFGKAEESIESRP